MTFVLAWYVLMSVIAFGMYWIDKRRATRGDWRVSEKALHTIELLGGWPGAWSAQRMFRHKWRKTHYVVVFWIIVAVHVAGWALWLAGVEARVPRLK
ncbi:MAG: DUF1294 domain-containing protein [Vicinamibacterales bacterium]